MANLNADAAKTPETSLKDLYRHQFNRLVDQIKCVPEEANASQRILAYQVAKAYITAQLTVRHSMNLYTLGDAHNAPSAGGGGGGSEESRTRDGGAQARKAAFEAMQAVVETGHNQVSRAAATALSRRGQRARRAPNEPRRAPNEPRHAAASCALCG